MPQLPKFYIFTENQPLYNSTTRKKRKYRITRQKKQEQKAKAKRTKNLRRIENVAKKISQKGFNKTCLTSCHDAYKSKPILSNDTIKLYYASNKQQGLIPKNLSYSQYRTNYINSILNSCVSNCQREFI